MPATRKSSKSSGGASSPRLAFKVKLEGKPGSDAAAVVAPFDVQEVFGTRARVPVCGTINGFPFRSSLAPMQGQHIMVVNREMRQGAGVKAGDTVTITMERDDAPREVEVPPDLKKALAADPQAQTAWDKYSYTYRKEFARWVTEAKKEETRTRRLQTTIEMLKTGKNLSQRD